MWKRVSDYQNVGSTVFPVHWLPYKKAKRLCYQLSTFQTETWGWKSKSAQERAPVSQSEEHLEVLSITETTVPEITEGQVKIGRITGDERQQFLGLMNKTCFSTSLNNLGCAKSAEMEIRLNDEEPFTYRPYRMAEKERGIVNEMVQDPVDNGVARPSDSSYTSPVLLEGRRMVSFF